VLQWIHDGKLPSYSSPGGRNRVDPQQLLEFLEVHGMRVPEELRRERACRILVVEDDDLVRSVLCRILEGGDLACEVETADNGISGCLKLASFRPDLVIMDIVMPELDGAEMCRVIRSSEEFADVKVLVLTGYIEDERIDAALAAGADAHACKPLSPSELMSRVHELLSGTPSQVPAACGV
jgi:CheY-like chemotaxis protein